jgi:probable F420-dependent oxidoreductase
VRFSLTLPRYFDPQATHPFERSYRVAQRVEELGYHAGYVGHHSFTPETRDPAAPFVFLAALAARTSRLRLGTGIYLAALHEPAATCEQVSMLDQLSGGRAVLGVGTGYRPYEFAGHHVGFDDRGERLDEILRVLRGAWESGRYHHDGPRYPMDDQTVYPMPIQRPHPPILVGGTSGAAIRRAARLGDGWFTLPMETLPVVASLVARYREECEAAGRVPYVCLMREAWTAPTAADVEAEWLERALAWHRYYWESGTRGDEADPVLQRVGAGERVDYATFAADRSIVGTPDQCVEHLLRWYEAVRFDEITLTFMSGPEPSEALERSVAGFATDVMPAFRAAVGAA